LKKILIVQPLLTAYNLPVFEEIAARSDLRLVVSKPEVSAGYGDIGLGENSQIDLRVVRQISIFGSTFGMYQVGVLREIFSFRPDAVMIFANLRYLSFWTVLFFCRLVGVKVFPHGHGVFKKYQISMALRVAYRLVFFLSTKYICYCNYVAKSFDRMEPQKNKIVTVENALINEFANPKKHKSDITNGILFLGRVREDSGLHLLINAVEKLRLFRGQQYQLHIIGDGDGFLDIKTRTDELPWVTLYGERYLQSEISAIADQCDVGVYPGDAGLSVVHYMSLGLPTVVHSELLCHKGPEPSYIEEGVNGIRFKRGSEEDLVRALVRVYQQPDELKEMQRASYASYVDLTNPSSASRFLGILCP